MKKDAVIFDIDGTLANCDHRKKWVDGTMGKKNWNKFYEGMSEDLPVNMVVLFFKIIHRDNLTPVLVTGRPDNYREKTVKWLRKYNLDGILYMRKEGDFRPDTVVKEEIYKNEIKSNYKVKLVLDDRLSVVEMWRRLGLKCWQVAEGNF